MNTRRPPPRRPGGSRKFLSSAGDASKARRAASTGNVDEFDLPSRGELIRHIGGDHKLLSASQLADALNIRDPQAREALARRLEAMVRDGQLLLTRRGGYALVAKLDLKRGTVIGHADGFGFLRLDDGGPDLFLSPKQMRRVLDGDEVLASIGGVDDRGRAEGLIVEILKRGPQKLLGRLHERGGIHYVVADNPRIAQEIVIPEGARARAKAGDVVLAEITESPSFHAPPVGRIVERVEGELSARRAVALTIAALELPTDFPEHVIAETASFGAVVDTRDLAGRSDLRELALVTIDGEDARDFDDAVYAERSGQGHRLLVAIADVAHYVQADSALDREAAERGTSVYFPGHVLPMLPEALSNGLCSLNPEVDRLVLCCEMRVSDSGEVSRTRFFEAVMHSRARLTYTRVAALLAGSEPYENSERPWLPERLQALHEVYAALLKARKERGALDFEGNEVKFEFDADGEVARIVPTVRNDAHRLIEEAMIAANVEAARLIKRKKLIAPFRVHEPPPDAKLRELNEALRDIGLKLASSADAPPDVRDFAALLERMRGRPDARALEQRVLRTQSLAVYQPANRGHFGLGLSAYTHYTSPIRRYADLLVHRAIKASLHEVANPLTSDALAARCQAISHNERRADEASRMVVDRLKAMHVAHRIGDRFAGVVTGVTNFGLFVELSGVFVTGLVHVSALPEDYYHFDALRQRLTAERRRLSFALGDALEVEIVNVSVEERKIDLKLIAKGPGRRKERG